MAPGTVMYIQIIDRETQRVLVELSGEEFECADQTQAPLCGSCNGCILTRAIASGHRIVYFDKERPLFISHHVAIEHGPNGPVELTDVEAQFPTFNEEGFLMITKANGRTLESPYRLKEVVLIRGQSYKVEDIEVVSNRQYPLAVHNWLFRLRLLEGAE